MSAPLRSGYTWEEDPVGNANTHDGRTHRRDVRAKGEPSIRALAKRPQDDKAHEIYSIAMERVGYVLARHLSLPVPTTYLETIDGRPHSVQVRIEHGKSWLQAPSAPAMMQKVTNANQFAKAAFFDVWMANTDRRDVNLMFEPQPSGTKPAMATSCQLWLVDHGQCGLWPATKFENRDEADIPTDPAVLDGAIRHEAEVVIHALMPVEYRQALKTCQGSDREQLVDGIRELEDDVIESVLGEVPDEYMSDGQRSATATFLKCRIAKLGSVLDQYWS